MTGQVIAVLGAGPTGASAARIAAEAGCRVLLVERGTLPRYKTCGGGLNGLSRAALPAGFAPPAGAHFPCQPPHATVPRQRTEDNACACGTNP